MDKIKYLMWELFGMYPPPAGFKDWHLNEDGLIRPCMGLCK